MRVDYALILAAGKGTRMGEIGKLLPKVIWPIYKKSILELEIEYCAEFGAQKTFVNLYNFKDRVEDHLKSKMLDKTVEIVIEDKVLDIGGAIHNIAKKVNYKGKLLVVNSDQFIMLNNEVKESFLKASEVNDTTLLTYTVNSNDKYNGILSRGDLVQAIKPNAEYQRDEHHETYTGMSIINLESLDPIQGESKFFDTVADFNKLRVGKINIKDSHYWDFGTLERYYSSMFKILEMINSEDPFVNFLKRQESIDVLKVKGRSYNSLAPCSICLAENDNQASKAIQLTKTSQLTDKKCIVYNDIVEQLEP